MLNEVKKKLGELIRLERENREIGLDEMAEKLKMTAEHLTAIESGDASALPSEVYFELFAKGYAEALGIDYSRTIDAIMESLQEISAVKQPGSKRKQDSGSPTPEGVEAVTAPDEDTAANHALIKKGLIIFGLIVVVFVLFLVGNWLFCDKEQSDAGSHEAVTEEIRSHEPEEKAKVEDSATAAFADYDWNVNLPGKPEKLKLKLIARQESWSTIVADGDTVLFRNLMPGRTYDVEAEYRMTVSVGIPRAVDIQLNGQPVDLRDPDSQRISRVHIDQTNVASILNRTNEPAEEQAADDAAWNEFESPKESSTTTEGE